MPATLETPIDTQNTSRSIAQQKEIIAADRLVARRPYAKDQMALETAIQGGMSAFDLAACHFPVLFLLASSS